MKGPERIETARLVLRKPVVADAGAIFARYASDPEVTRLMAWLRHQSVEDTRSFLAFSDAEWERWPAGPYLIESREGPRLLGGTGFAFETPTVAATGYVLARDAWGRGYATEALRAMAALAPRLGIRRLYALCHPTNAASVRVLEKGGFLSEGRVERRGEFPNLSADAVVDCLCYAIRFE